MLSDIGIEVNPLDDGATKYVPPPWRQAGRGLERNLLRHVVETEILVLDAVGVDLNDAQS